MRVGRSVSCSNFVITRRRWAAGADSPPSRVPEVKFSVGCAEQHGPEAVGRCRAEPRYSQARRRLSGVGTLPTCFRREERKSLATMSPNREALALWRQALQLVEAKGVRSENRDSVATLICRTGTLTVAFTPIQRRKAEWSGGVGEEWGRHRTQGARRDLDRWHGAGSR